MLCFKLFCIKCIILAGHMQVGLLKCYPSALDFSKTSLFTQQEHPRVQNPYSSSATFQSNTFPHSLVDCPFQQDFVQEEEDCVTIGIN